MLTVNAKNRDYFIIDDMNDKNCYNVARLNPVINA